MTVRTAPKLAWTCWLFTVGFIAVTLFLDHLNSPTTLLSDTFGALVQFAFATVGLLITSRRHENPIGWVLAIGTLLMVVADFSLEYSVYGLLIAPGSLPSPLWTAVLGGWLRSIGFILLLFVALLLFPDGRLPSARWRKPAWFILACTLLGSLGILFTPDFSDVDSRLSSFSNPLGNTIQGPLPRLLAALFVPAGGAAILTCVAALAVRFQRSKGDERQQLKWLTYSSFLSAAILLLLYVNVLLNVNTDSQLGGFLFNLLLAPIPIAIGSAVLKYRLYDIDLIINRTLVYGTLTGALALVYLGSVVLLEQLVRSFTGQAHSDLVVVSSTLAIAALFTPLRRRIQSFIDRRFYRHKYDAAKTLAEFSATVRDEVDLNRLTDHLLKVVEETIQPADASLWLRQPERRA
ncbi:MAG: hypothetical protein ACR2M0_00350 [Chloroflexia bacterium]